MYMQKLRSIALQGATTIGSTVHRTMAWALLALAVIAAPIARAADTILEFSTTAGTFDIELFDNVAPLTVTNFMDYVKSGSFVESLFHRSAVNGDGSPFVIQGGAYTITGSQINAIPTKAAVKNEYLLPNIRGTIAMAKQGGDPNSATSQYFINTSDNSTTLNQNNNGGFTVFGQVLGTGMSVVDTISHYPRYDASAQLGPAFNEIPLYPNGALTKSNLVLVHSITVVPEPSTLLLGFAAGALMLRRRPTSRRL
jgi:peptidyl-prolyl cis-trans isomerase A (cyclophilin A)